MSLKTFLATAVIASTATVACMLFVPTIATGFEGLVLLFLSVFATG